MEWGCVGGAWWRPVGAWTRTVLATRVYPRGRVGSGARGQRAGGCARRRGPAAAILPGARRREKLTWKFEKEMTCQRSILSEGVPVLVFTLPSKAVRGADSGQRVEGICHVIVSSSQHFNPARATSATATSVCSPASRGSREHDAASREAVQYSGRTLDIDPRAGRSACEGGTKSAWRVYLGCPPRSGDGGDGDDSGARLVLCPRHLRPVPRPGPRQFHLRRRCQPRPRLNGAGGSDAGREGGRGFYTHPFTCELDTSNSKTRSLVKLGYTVDRQLKLN